MRFCNKIEISQTNFCLVLTYILRFKTLIFRLCFVLYVCYMFTGIRETVMKRMVRLDKLFAEQKFDEAVTFYTDDFAGLYPGQAIIKDKKGEY